MRKIKPDAILVGDVHFSESQPTARTDNFYQVQFEKLDFISDVQKKYNCPVLQAGDLFNYWKASPMLLSDIMDRLPSSFYAIFGNHDLPQHQYDLRHKCGLFTLQKANKVHILPGCHWEQTPSSASFTITTESGIIRNILVWHVMTYHKKEGDWQGGMAARNILRQYPDFDLILTGHNHKTFEASLNGRILVNPGALLRTDADQINHQPVVYLYYAESNTIEPIEIPINKDAITREHLVLKQERDSRILKFVENLNTDWAAALSFEQNLQLFFIENKTKPSVQKIIHLSIE